MIIEPSIIPSSPSYRSSAFPPITTAVGPEADTLAAPGGPGDGAGAGCVTCAFLLLHMIHIKQRRAIPPQELKIAISVIYSSSSSAAGAGAGAAVDVVATVAEVSTVVVVVGSSKNEGGVSAPTNSDSWSACMYLSSTGESKLISLASGSRQSNLSPKRKRKWVILYVKYDYTLHSVLKKPESQQKK